MIEQSLSEWRAQVRAIMGENGDATALKFRCPKCDEVSSAADFVAIGRDADRAATNCIGRFISERGCDWAAYGLLGTMGHGRLIDKENGETIEVFDFA